MPPLDPASSSRLLHPRRLERAALAAILLLTFALRAAAPGLVEFKFDEAGQYLRARGVVAGQRPAVGAPSSVAIPSPALSAYVSALPVAVVADPRSLVVFRAFLAAGTSLLLYLAARPLLGAPGALLAILLLATNPWAVQLDRKIWQHVFPLFTAAMLWAALRRRPGLFFLSAGLQLASHLVALLQALPMAVTALAHLRWLRRPRAWLGLGAGLLVLSPYLLFVVRQRAWAAVQSTASGPSLESIRHFLAAASGDGIGVLIQGPQPIALLTRPALALALLLVLAGLAALRRLGGREGLLVGSWALLPLLPPLAGLIRPQLHYAYALYPSLFLLLATGVRRWPKSVMALGLGLAGLQLAATLWLLVALGRGGASASFGRPLAHWLELEAEVKAAFQEPQPRLAPTASAADPRPRLALTASGTDPRQQEEPAILQAVLGDEARIAFLGQNGIPGQLYRLGEATYWLRLGPEGPQVERVPPFDPPASAPLALSRLGPRLLEVELPASARPGETLELTTVWALPGPRPGDWKVFHHLVAGDGAKAGQLDGFSMPSDQWLEGDVLRQTLQIRIAPDAPPGTHELVVGLYSGVTGERVLFESGADHLIVGRVQIAGD